MDGHRFDSLAKSIARSGSRRNLLRIFGGGSVVAALGRAAPETLASAQDTPCILAFTGNVRIGPSAHQPLFGDKVVGELQGQLTFTLDQHNTIVQGQIKLSDGSTVPVTGQANGPAINLRLLIDNQQVAVAVGTATRNVIECKGAVGGPMTGPRIGDLGDWRGDLKAAAVSTPTPTPTPATSGGGQSAPPTDTPIPPPLPTDTAAPQPTETPTAIVCGACQTPFARTTNTTGGCNPLPDGTSCGSGLICCGGACVDTNSDHANCGGCAKPCSVVANCVNRACQRRVVQPPVATVGGVFDCGGLTPCGGGVCVDTSSDSANCGSCGTMCGTDGTGINLVCTGGQCGCPSGLIACGGCVDPLTDLTNCGGCGATCAQNQRCLSGVCQ